MTTAAPFIPDYITVHLGSPDSNADNVTLPFADYIANVASSEIYPTWPENAIRANIYSQISFALNRIYTDYYRSRGYSFDITNSTAIDQSFVNGRDIFENIQQIVGDIFNSYIRRRGAVEPLFAMYCNGTTVTCDGLSQWGTVDLAEQGYTPYEILKYYYGDDIDIVMNVPVGNEFAVAPTLPLSIGMANDDIRRLQIRLNRISNNYPSIPKIVIPDGNYGYDTLDSVKAFQEIFNLNPDGIVGQATWYAVQRIYSAVKRLNELDSEGVKFEEITRQFPQTLSYGDSGIGVDDLQYYINYLSGYYDTIPTLAIDGYFGDDTLAAVIDMQNTFGLVPDGIVGEETWNTMYRAYLGIIQSIPVKYVEGQTIPFGGVTLRLGAENEAVRVLQEYLSFISQIIPEITNVNPTGYFGTLTQASVASAQEFLGLPPSGSVDARTWDSISSLYSDLYIGSMLGEGQYPGYPIGS